MPKKQQALEDQTIEFVNTPPAQQKYTLSPEEVAKQEELNASVSFSLPSKEDSAGQSKFCPLNEDVFYEMTVSKAEVRERPNYNDPSAMEKVVMLAFVIDKTTTGEPILDINGKVQNNGERMFWEFLSTTATGFKADNTPSKTRACLCALMNTDVNAPLKISSIEELIGKKCKVRLGIKEKKDGEKKNYAEKYKSLQS